MPLAESPIPPRRAALGPPLLNKVVKNVLLPYFGLKDLRPAQASRNEAVPPRRPRQELAMERGIRQQQVRAELILFFHSF